MDANTYYNSLISQGYSPEQAQQFTAQHYPDFGAESASTSTVADSVVSGNVHMGDVHHHTTTVAPVQSVQPVIQITPVQPVVQQQQIYQPQSQMYTTSPGMMVMPIASKKTVWVAPWVGIGIIFLMMFMPFVSVDDGSFELTGFELMEEVAEIIDDMESEGGDDGGDGEDVNDEWMFFFIAAFLLAISPFIFLFTALISALLLAAGKHPVVIGTLHMVFFGAFMICSVIGTIDLGFGEKVSIHSDLAGFGFFIAGLSGIALCIKA